MQDTTYITLSVSIHRIAETYLVELTHHDPDSQAQVAPVRGPVTLDLAALLAAEGLPDRYGETLAAQLFADREVAQRFAQVVAVTEDAERSEAADLAGLGVEVHVDGVRTFN